MPLNILFASWGNPGNLNPFLTAARRLRDRGHKAMAPDMSPAMLVAEMEAIAARRWSRSA
jgi:hypothetical protein